MSKLLCYLVVGTLVFGFGTSVYAAESKVEKMTSDQTQAQYQRKSITYLGIDPTNVNIPTDELEVVEKAIRAKIELKRFDYNAVGLDQTYTIDKFVADLREYVKKISVDRAAAEAEYEARFKRARVLATDIDRIMNSAYFYVIKVLVYKNVRAKCPDNKLAALAMGCVPNQEGMLATVNATVTFYRANLTDETKKPYELIKEVKHMPTKGFEEFNVIEVNRMKEIMKSTGLEAATEASSSLADFLSKGMKQIPDFQLLTPVQTAMSDGVEFMLGKGEGVRLDDTYDVNEYDAAGDKKLLGYVKVRNIGDATGSGGGTPSYAEKVKEKQKFVGGELMVEHPMVGMAVGLHIVGQYTLKDVLSFKDSAEGKFYPGLGLYIDKDLAHLTGIPEFYLSVEGDFLLVGETTTEKAVYLTHAMLGAKKKWYMESLVFSLGLRGGISYYVISGYEDDAIGFGADLLGGVEYYFKPEFSIYFKAVGRYFTNPLQFGLELPDEIGIQGTLGAFLAF
jgi:hypothetical protein